MHTCAGENGASRPRIQGEGRHGRPQERRSARADKIDEHNRRVTRVGFHPPGRTTLGRGPTGPREEAARHLPTRERALLRVYIAEPTLRPHLPWTRSCSSGRAVAEHASARTWRDELGARCAKEAKAHYVSSLRRNLGVSAAMRENARLVLYPRVDEPSARPSVWARACTGGPEMRIEHPTCIMMRIQQKNGKGKSKTVRHRGFPCGPPPEY